MSEEKESSGVLRSLARRLRKATDLDDDGLLASVLETGDKAKTEMIRLIAKEVRGYVEALEVGQDLRDFLTNHSLEVKASIHLKKILPEEKDPNVKNVQEKDPTDNSKDGQ